jgi:hypothetical protein
MFRRFLERGIAIAGIDVGESFGSPRGRATYAAFSRFVEERLGLSGKAILHVPVPSVMQSEDVTAQAR